MPMSWRDAIVQILGASTSAMHCDEIAEAIIAQRLRESVGATPTSTVFAEITRDLKRNRDSSPFVRVNRGEYMLRTSVSAVAGATLQAQPETPEEPEEAEGEDAGLIQAFGMFWRKDFVEWTNNTKLFGQQQAGAEKVDLAPQVGIYLLHDVREVIYVGRTTDRPLGKRLFEHTSDRLNGRWTRFSWFGIRRVTAEGTIVPVRRITVSDDQLIAAMEALLIEGLEPRQNRRRGDQFQGVEYVQLKDPELERREQSAVLDELRRRI